MKKVIAALLCIVMLCGTAALAEEAAGLVLGTIGNSQTAYTVSCTAPKGFTVFHKQAETDHQTIEGMLANDSTKGMSYLFVISQEEDYADIENLAAAEEARLNELTAAYQEEGLTVTTKDQGGRKFMYLAGEGAKKNTFLSVETIVNGCLIQISAAPVEQTVSSMTEKQAQTAIDFLASLTFVSADPFPADEAEETEAENEAQEKAEPETPAESAPVLVGGWQVNDAPIVSRLSEEEQKVFGQVVAATGMDYEPAAVLATQVVAGTNYAFLCREKDGDREWIVVTVFNGLNGEVQVLNAHVLALYNLLTADKPLPAGLAGGWSLHEPDNGEVLPDEKAQAAFSQAVEAANEVLSPIVLLGTQVVSGINYKVLARGESALYLVDVYAPLNGDASITAMEMLDLLSYVSAN